MVVAARSANSLLYDMIQCCVWCCDPGFQGFEFGAFRFHRDAGCELGAGLFIKFLATDAQTKFARLP